jgi:hypothetical protein
MNAHVAMVVLLLEVSLFGAAAQSPTAATDKARPEMQRLFNAFLGTWSVTEKLEPSETTPDGGAGQGEEVYRSGPGGGCIIEEIHLKEGSHKISGLGVAWWDQTAQGYKTLWCDSENPNGCIMMAHLGKWEGDQWVLGDEFERDGKKFVFKEVFSAITPTSFTQTLYQGEAGKELKRLLTIYATKKSK